MSCILLYFLLVLCAPSIPSFLHVRICLHITQSRSLLHVVARWPPYNIVIYPCSSVSKEGLSRTVCVVMRVRRFVHFYPIDFTYRGFLRTHLTTFVLIDRSIVFSCYSPWHSPHHPLSLCLIYSPYYLIACCISIVILIVALPNTDIVIPRVVVHHDVCYVERLTNLETRTLRGGERYP